MPASTRSSTSMMMSAVVIHRLIAGVIKLSNLRRVAKELGEDIQEGELQQMLTRADILDKDGGVSEEEFYNFLTTKIAPS